MGLASGKRGLRAVAALLAVIGVGALAYGQTATTQPQLGGVKIDPEGMISTRTKDTTLATKRDGKKPGLAYVSLPGLMKQLQDDAAAGKKTGDDVRYMGGLTQIRYVLVYPEQKDIVIAGPAEALDTSNPHQAVGKSTGRPALRLDDLVTLLRATGGELHTRRTVGDRMIGCSIDVPEDAMEKSRAVMRDHAKASNGQLAEAMKKAIGPQTVRVFGVPTDTTVALSLVAADFTMKRMSLGLEPIPVAGVGSAVEPGKFAAARFWFEPSYEPLAVSEDGLTYEIKGARLQLKSGVQMFDTHGATDASKAFAAGFSKKFGDLAARVPEFADLQNVADLALLVQLLRGDGLTKKAGVDWSWLMAAKNYTPAAVPTPKFAETQVAVSSGAVAAGGVALQFQGVMASREQAKGAAEFRKRPEGSWLLVEAAEKKAP